MKDAAAFSEGTVQRSEDMDTYRLRLQLGGIEFEAEGDQEWVEKQKDLFLAQFGGSRLEKTATASWSCSMFNA